VLESANWRQSFSNLYSLYLPPLLKNRLSRDIRPPLDLRSRAFFANRPIGIDFLEVE